MPRIYKTIDLLHAVYNGKLFKNKKFRNVKTGEVIRQGESPLPIEVEKHFFIGDGFGINFMPEINNPKELEEWLAQEWEEVQQPIRFTEAVEALNAGKTIYCQYINSYTDKGDVLITNIYEPNATNELRNEKGEAPTLWMMLHADWYIKED